MATSWTKLSGNNASWSNIAKPLPTTSVVTGGFSGGDPIGLLLALTYSTSTVTSVVTGIWSDVAKASGTNFTKIPKAT